MQNFPSTPGSSDDTDAPWRAEAEDVRAWLVELRGGGTFLSPRDGALLLGWLEDGIGVAAILRALEATVEKRRAKPSRVPLSLAACRPLLERSRTPRARSRTQVEPSHVHANLDDRVDALAAAARADLALLLGPGPERAQARCRVVRAFHAAHWELLSPTHASRIAAEEATFAPFRDTVDEATFAQLCEEAARARARAAFPDLSIDAVFEDA